MSSNKIEISIKDIPEIIKQLEEAGKEIERLNNKVEELDTKWINSLQQEEEYEEGWRELKEIIDEVREYIEELNDYGIGKQAKKELLEILDKGE